MLKNKLLLYKPIIKFNYFPIRYKLSNPHNNIINNKLHCAYFNTPSNSQSISSFKRYFTNCKKLYNANDKNSSSSSSNPIIKPNSLPETESDEALAAAITHRDNNKSMNNSRTSDRDNITSSDNKSSNVSGDLLDVVSIDDMMERIEDAIQELKVQHHSLNVYKHIEDKLKQSNNPRLTEAYTRILNNLQYEYVHIDIIHNELIVERIDKDFTIALPLQSTQPPQQPKSTQASASNNAPNKGSLDDIVNTAAEKIKSGSMQDITPNEATDLDEDVEHIEHGIGFGFEWTTERNKVQGMGVFNYRLALYIMLNDMDEPVNIIELDEGNIHKLDKSLLIEAKKRLQCDELSEKEFMWLISVLCTHPSDLAFDALTKALEKNEIISNTKTNQR